MCANIFGREYAYATRGGCGGRGSLTEFFGSLGSLGRGVSLPPPLDLYTVLVAEDLALVLVDVEEASVG